MCFMSMRDGEVNCTNSSVILVCVHVHLQKKIYDFILIAQHTSSCPIYSILIFYSQTDVTPDCLSEKQCVKYSLKVVTS